MITSPRASHTMEVTLSETHNLLQYIAAPLTFMNLYSPAYIFRPPLLLNRAPHNRGYIH